MTFLQPFLLAALPLAAVPVIIHLIHLYRRRQVKWAAMMFLRAAQRMNKGFSRLRQIVILALRVLAVAALIFVITRPLAGGWLGLTGGAPDTLLILLDRSASMEQHNPATGVSKRLAGLRNLAKAINDAVGTRSRLVLIDSATGSAQPIEKADALLDLPQAGPTETAADIPALLQSALDYITTNKSGRTDIWVLSDLQQSDWDAAGGRWETLRSAFSTLQGARFHLLTYPQTAPDDLAVSLERVERRESGEKAELLFDLRVSRQAENPQPAEVPVRFVIDGAATTLKVELKENQVALQGHAIPIDKAAKCGWGRIELPADVAPANNVFHFVFDEPAPLRSVIVSDDAAESATLRAALSAQADPARSYVATVLSPNRAAEIPWEETALVIWHAPIPPAEDPLAQQLKSHAAAGRAILFLPPETPSEAEIFGLRWGPWEGAADKPQTVEWWRNDAGLLANTRNGTALPVGAVEISRRCTITGEGVPLARVAERSPLIMRTAAAPQVHFLGTLPSTASSLARDGVVLFALLHRALDEGAQTLGKAQHRTASAAALDGELSQWQRADDTAEAVFSDALPLRAGVVKQGDRLIALNRPPGEDQPPVLTATTLNELFAGLDFRVLKDTLEEGRSLTSEVWRTFLIIMGLALISEALLCMPGRREEAVRPASTPFPKPAPAAPVRETAEVR